jgi:hypothetical protein
MNDSGKTARGTRFTYLGQTVDANLVQARVVIAG